LLGTPSRLETPRLGNFSVHMDGSEGETGIAKRASGDGRTRRGKCGYRANDGTCEGGLRRGYRGEVSCASAGGEVVKGFNYFPTCTRTTEIWGG
jgi:hypothetical protein